MRTCMAAFLLVLAAVPAAAESFTFGSFGNVTVYRPAGTPHHVVLFVSGDGGWNQGVVDMAKELTTLDALVAGIDIRKYLAAIGQASGKCSYPAADFEALSQFMQKKLDLPEYISPVLVGYSSGATLVYATLVEAPPSTFAGAMSLGFCPDLQLKKPLCKGNGLEWTTLPKGKGVSFLPAKSLTAPWIAFQGTIDQVCDPKGTEDFVKQVGGGEIVVLPKVGHGYSVPRNWMPQFRESFAKIVNTFRAPTPAATTRSPSPASVAGLPLIEVATAADASPDLAVIVSGDGGWANIDRSIGTYLSQHGTSVVGLNSLQYFWKPRTPDGAARDLESIIRHYLAAWHKERVILIGYSRGADVLPFMAARLPADLKEKVGIIALLGPSMKAQFEFHVSDWLTDSDRGFPVRPEVEKLQGKKTLCFYGDEETDSLCRGLSLPFVQAVSLGGGHHFGGDYASIAERIMKESR